MITTANEMLIAVLGSQPTVPSSTVEEIGGRRRPGVRPDTGRGDRRSRPADLPRHPRRRPDHGRRRGLPGDGAEHGHGHGRMTTWSVDYRMPPDHPYPAALDDCLAVYRRLLEARPPERIVVGGGSAGGNLAAALMLRARDEGLPMPAGAGAPDARGRPHRIGRLVRHEPRYRRRPPSSLAESIALYADGHDLTDPYLSPLFGDFTAAVPADVPADRAPATCSCRTRSACTAGSATPGSTPSSTSSRRCPTAASSALPRTTSSPPRCAASSPSIWRTPSRPSTPPARRR